MGQRTINIIECDRRRFEAEGKITDADPRRNGFEWAEVNTDIICPICWADHLDFMDGRGRDTQARRGVKLGDSIREPGGDCGRWDEGGGMKAWEYFFPRGTVVTCPRCGADLYRTQEDFGPATELHAEKFAPASIHVPVLETYHELVCPLCPSYFRRGGGSAPRRFAAPLRRFHPALGCVQFHTRGGWRPELCKPEEEEEE